MKAYTLQRTVMLGLRPRELHMVASASSLFGGVDFNVNVSLDADISRYKQLVPLSASISLKVLFAGKSELLVAINPCPVGAGTIRPNLGKEFSLSGHMPLTPHALERIEELRRGNNLRVKIGVRTTFLASPHQGSDPEILDYFGETDREIPKSEWVERFLHVLGFEDLEVWEVRTAGAKPHASLSREYDRIRRAINQLDHGNWVAAHSECREAVGAVKSRLKDGPLKSVDKVAVQRLEGFLSVALHLETATEDNDWQPNRQDAILAVQLTKAWLDWVSGAIEADSS